jgi:hypothetical protein
MAATGGSPLSDSPRKCYNAWNHFQLGWFVNATMSFVPPVHGNRKIKLMSLVQAADATMSQPVLIEIIANQNLYLQYNEQAGYNDGNDMIGFANRVTIVEVTVGNKTNLIAGLDVGDVYSHGNVEIRVCDKDDPTAATAGAVIVGIGTPNVDTCSLPFYEYVPPPPVFVDPRRPGGRNPILFPPSQPEQGNLTCPDSSNDTVVYQKETVVESIDGNNDITTPFINRTCSDIATDDAESLNTFCQAVNLASLTFQRVFQVCGNACPTWSGCGLPINRPPRQCINKPSAVVKVWHRNRIQVYRCDYIGMRNFRDELCPQTVLALSDNEFQHVNDARVPPQVYQVCENECSGYLNCNSTAV